MKLAVFFQDAPLGTVETSEHGEMIYSGPSREGIKDRIDHFARKTRLRGDDLLRYALSKLDSYTWAKEVSNN